MVADLSLINAEKTVALLVALLRVGPVLWWSLKWLAVNCSDLVTGLVEVVSRPYR